MSSSRLYLYVPPEEEAEVEALGALRDPESACWYIGSGEDPTRFSKWLEESDEDAQDEELSITSDEAYVASATVSCWRCRARIEVICIYCESGTASGEPLARFTVSHISAMDSALVRQLEPWGTFRALTAKAARTAISPITVRTAGLCRRISICIPSRISLFSAFRTPRRARSSSHRSWEGFG